MPHVVWLGAVVIGSLLLIMPAMCFAETIPLNVMSVTR